MARKLVLASLCSTELPRRMACCTSWWVSPAGPPPALRVMLLALALQAGRGEKGLTGSDGGVGNRPLEGLATCRSSAARELGSVARIAGHPKCLLCRAAMWMAPALLTWCDGGAFGESAQH